ncbi:MAG: peptidylprolyl isomerase [Deltaproteobacteria bacterium]|nr:peptidylprolyl isomerase [Deltaproteobacteria bacterium]
MPSYTSLHFLPALALCAVMASGCSSCDSQAASDESAPGAGAHRSVKAAQTPLTVDGVPLIENRRPLGPTPSRPGEGRDRHLVREPTSPDPQAGEFSLEQAVEGMPTDGPLVAEINTDLGTIMCDLYAERAPNTVANFIGLARGKRSWWDAQHAQWRRRPYYNRRAFDRVIPNDLIQAGDYLGDGTSRVGYSIPDEPWPGQLHDRAGLLCMASTGVNENGAQFFITDAARPELDADSRYTVFGRCQQTDVIAHIARVPQGEDNRPLTRVEIIRILIRRIPGGAVAARRTPPRVQDPEDLHPRNASPGPAELHYYGREPQPTGISDLPPGALELPSMAPTPMAP